MAISLQVLFVHTARVQPARCIAIDTNFPLGLPASQSGEQQRAGEVREVDLCPEERI